MADEVPLWCPDCFGRSGDPGLEVCDSVSTSVTVCVEGSVKFEYEVCVTESVCMSLVCGSESCSSI